MQIDHTCHVTFCVNPAHLREATNKQNNENKRPYSASRSGIRGVTWHRKAKKWQVQAGHNGSMHYGGIYDSLDEAEAAAVALRNRLFTHNIEHA